MYHPRLLKFVVICLSIFLHHSVYSWGLTGHRIVGGLAEKHLTDKTTHQVRRVLDGYKLQDVSNWADEIKSDRSALSQSLSKWHYMEATDASAIDNDPSGDWPLDIQQALVLITKRLKHQQFQAPLTEPVLLRLLIHLVADAHQPLHVGNGKDHGANACYVRWFSSKWTTRLHAIWDSKLIDAYKLSYTEYVDIIDHVSEKTIKQWQAQPVSAWLKESRALHSEIYPVDKRFSISDYCVSKRSQIKHDKVPKIGFEYQSRVRPILNQRLAQAGIRLAGTLNEIYDNKALLESNNANKERLESKS